MVNTSPRVMIVDDQPLFRAGLARLLDEDPRIHVVGEANDGQEALRQLPSISPDVVLMDVKMPNMDGLEATHRIKESHSGVKVLILSTFDADEHVLNALSAGASGYVMKDSPLEAIVSGILTVVAGGQVMSLSVAERLIKMATGGPPASTSYDGLTAREIEILRLLASGVANKQIAFRLKISDKTVRNHISHIYEKLNIFDRAQAALYAVRKGLVEV